MHKFTYLIVLLFAQLCLCQVNTAEKFDIEYFKHKAINTGGRLIFTEIVNDTLIKYTELKDKFLIFKNKVNSPYLNQKVFYKKNCGLKAEVNVFYRINIGISKKYDEQGNLTEAKDWDKIEDRKCTINDLIAKIKKNYNIDMLKSDKVSASSAYVPNRGYCYILNLTLSKEIRNIYISVKTGEILSDEVVDLKE